MLKTMNLVDIALARWGVKGEVKKLPGECDENFHIQSGETQYILKISSVSESLAVLELQTTVLESLAATSQPFEFPKPIRSINGVIIEAIQTGEGIIRYARLFSYVPGQLLGTLPLHSATLCESVGNQVGQLTLALSNIQHPAAKRYSKWDLQQAMWIEAHLSIFNAEDQALIRKYLNVYHQDIHPQLSHLRQGIIHGDLNDYNLVVAKQSPGDYRVTGFIDFGDLVQTAQINELAIALTYLLLNKPDPLAAAANAIRAYHAVYPLEWREVACLYHLICMRLCVSVVNSALRKIENPHDPYLTISEKPAWGLLRKLDQIHPRFALAVFREACQWEPVAESVRVTEWLNANGSQIVPLFQFAQTDFTPFVFDLSPGSLQAEQFESIMTQLTADNIPLAIGRYNEARLIYSSDQYLIPGNLGPEARTIHLGMDFFVKSGEPIHAPLAGVVHSFADNAIHQDYGPTIILEHTIVESSLTFYTLYGHLSRESLTHLTVGKSFRAGEVIGWVGEQAVNGGWLPHLHFQIITDMLGMRGNYPGVARASQRTIWSSLCPDANLLARCPADLLQTQSLSQSAIAKLRDQFLAKNVGLSYDEPLHFVRGVGQYLFDPSGRRYLDCVNNVCHIGHCHPAVVRKGQEQMALLNTNTRYYHENLVKYAEKLLSKFPAPLEVCYFVNSGSEANELALRLARAHTGRKNIVVMENGYHGNTSAMIDISAYKFNGKGGTGKPDFVTVLSMPDLLRGKNLIFNKAGLSESISAFIAESLLSCGGQIELPPGYLQSVYAAIREVGGLCIADEVQVGFGRLGTHYWGFETQEVEPDIVTLGKPIGNGHPIGAVITTRAIAESFCNGMEFFSTYGGNPVSCAIGMKVLEVIDQEKLQDNALLVGEYFKSQLIEMKQRYPIIGDVRGRGLFLGIEIVSDQRTNSPAPDLAKYLVNAMKARGVLLSVDGPYHNVIKIKPPMVITQHDVDYMVSQLHPLLALLCQI